MMAKARGANIKFKYITVIYTILAENLYTKSSCTYNEN